MKSSKTSPKNKRGSRIYFSCTWKLKMKKERLTLIWLRTKFLPVGFLSRMKQDGRLVSKVITVEIMII